MDAFTANELSRLRSHPQSFRSKLAVFQPAIVWSGTLNAGHAKGARILSVTTLTGDVNDILADTTLLIDNGINQERLRIRSASGTSITVSENPLDWAASVPLKALLLFEPHPVFNRITNNNGIITYFEDYDVGYTDDNEDFTPVVNIGAAAYVVEIPASGTFSNLDLDANDSFVFDSTISTYSWAILLGDRLPGEAEIVESSTNPTVTMRFRVPGDYYASCTITAANGKSHTGYRPVMVRIDTDGQSGSPFYDFSIESLEGSRDSGYWESSITVFEDCSVDDFPRNVPIVIYGDVTYGEGASRSTTHVGWHYDNASHQRFIGYVREEVWTEEYRNKGRGVSFEAIGLCGLLDEIENYPAWLRFGATPTAWTDMAGLNVDRMIYYYLHNRSTVLRMTDWHRTEDTRLMNYAELPAGKMFSAMRNFLTGTIFADMVSDRQSTLWCELDGQLLSDSDRATAVVDVQELTEDDFMTDITILTTRDRPEVSWLSIDGLHYDGISNTPLISYAPGFVISSRGGNPETISGLVLNATQASLNTLSGRLFSLRNNPFKTIPFELQGVYPYDIAPQSSVSHSLNSGTFREETFEDNDFIVRGVKDEIMPESFGLVNAISTESTIRDAGSLVAPNMPRAITGVQGLFPVDISGVDPDDFDPDWGDFDPIPDAEFDIAGALLAETPNIAAFNDDGFIYITGQWGQVSPAWSRLSGGWSGTLHQIEVDPFSPLYLGLGNTVNCWVVTEDTGAGIYYVSDVFGITGPPSTVLQKALDEDIFIKGGVSMHFSFGVEGWGVITWYQGTGFTNSLKGVWSSFTTDKGASWSTDLHIVNTYHTGSTTGITPGIHVSSKIAGLAYTTAHLTISDFNTSVGYKSTDFGASWSRFTDLDGVVNEGARLSQEIHVPYNDNDESNIIYFGYARNTGAIIRRIAGVNTDIKSQSDETIALAKSRWTLMTSPINRQRLTMIVQTFGGGAHRELYVSRNAGTTLTRLEDPTDFEWVGISGSNEDILYFTGDNASIAYSTDFGDTILDQSGNIPAAFPGAATFKFLVGG